jgi:hypothetical protein
MALHVKKVKKLLRAGVAGRHTDGDVKGLMLCIESKTLRAGSDPANHWRR